MLGCTAWRPVRPATVATITEAGERAAVHGDIRSDLGVGDLRASVSAITDRVDIVVNNYGADGTTGEEATGDTWHASYDTNVVSAVRVVDAFVEPMRRRGWGRIVFVATVGATRPGARIPEYYAAKGALPSVTVSLAKHLAGTGITVHCVSPGLIATPDRAHWKEAVPVRADVNIDDLDLIGDQLVVVERDHGKLQLRMIDDAGAGRRHGGRRAVLAHQRHPPAVDGGAADAVT